MVVEAWHDREYCSDLYAYDFDGNLLRRLTQKPLPSCGLAAVSEDGHQVMFVANASAFYNLNVRHDSIASLSAGNVEAVAIAPGGKGVAYAARGFAEKAGLVLRVQPLVSGGPFQRTEIALQAEPNELALAPKGKQVLLTEWSGNRARVDRCDLESGKIEGWMVDPKVSYYSPTFAPDGSSVAAIGEDLNTGKWTIVSKSWPDGEFRTLRSAPRGVVLSSPVFTADGKHLLFWQSDVLARMPAGGGDAIGLSGELDNSERAMPHPALLDRVRPVRASSLPLLVERWIATVEHEKPDGRLVLIDVRSKEVKTVPLPKGRLVSAVVVE